MVGKMRPLLHGILGQSQDEAHHSIIIIIIIIIIFYPQGDNTIAVTKYLTAKQEEV